MSAKPESQSNSQAASIFPNRPIAQCAEASRFYDWACDSIPFGEEFRGGESTLNISRKTSGLETDSQPPASARRRSPVTMNWNSRDRVPFLVMGESDQIAG